MVERRTMFSFDWRSRKRKCSESKSSGGVFSVFPPSYRILALYKRRRYFRQQQCKDNGTSESKACRTLHQTRHKLSEKQLEEALLSARFAFHTYSAEKDTDVRFERLLRAKARFNEEEKCYSYLMTMEGSDKRFYNAHILYNVIEFNSVDVFICYFIRPAKSYTK